jgi:hypothetical protein
MHCYECKKQGKSEEAVALCPTCSVGLCMHHLRETSEAVSGQTWFSCPHDATARSKSGVLARN